MKVIATAGHVDHGKSTLVRALTGMEPDRWAEERRRGLTIDLGYAWTSLSDGTSVALVDVPGHEKFVTNMLAGVGPVPAVLLVIAADEGWCRQTAEHVAALDALAVTHGVLAITRSDLGDPELAIEEARDYLQGTSLEGIEAVAVNGIDGSGVDELRDALQRMLASLPPAPSDATRLWVDRVFTVRGAGTVVTGTLGSGHITHGDELTLAATGEPVQVRSMECLGERVDSAGAVARVALNLRGVKRENVRRGDALIGRDAWVMTDVVDVALLGAEQKLPGRVSVHIGSAAVPARVRPLGDGQARLQLTRSLPLHVGERAVLRDPGRRQVVAGARLLDVLPPPLSRRGAARRRAAQLLSMSPTPTAAAEVARRAAVRTDTLRAAGVPVPSTPPPDVVAIDDWLVDAQAWSDWRARLVEVVDTWSAEHPRRAGVPRSAAAGRLALPDADLLAPLVAAEPKLTLDADGIHRVDGTVTLPAAVRTALEALMRRLDRTPFDPPGAPELAAMGLDDGLLAAEARRSGELVRLAAGVYLREEAIITAEKILTELEQPFTASEARQALGTARRVALPLLELLDRREVTERIDQQRRVVRSAAAARAQR